MAEPAVPPVLCFGEVLWDCLPRGLFPGGAPINVAYHLQKLGLTAYPVTAVGSDFLGQELVRRLEQWGLDSRFVTVLTDKQTGVVRAHIQPDGSAKYEIVEDVAWDWIEPEDEVFQMGRGVPRSCLERWRNAPNTIASAWMLSWKRWPGA